ncbi:hypothetical protein LJB42_003065 [Komagataella kurtzmanii]|nr:hypothetical protein LJB42_003065 [Komagataella kurtzmanii]
MSSSTRNERLERLNVKRVRDKKNLDNPRPIKRSSSDTLQTRKYDYFKTLSPPPSIQRKTSRSFSNLFHRFKNPGRSSSCSKNQDLRLLTPSTVVSTPDSLFSCDNGDDYSTPTSPLASKQFTFYYSDSASSSSSSVNEEFSKLTLKNCVTTDPVKRSLSSRIFEIPEILNLILSCLDDSESRIPREKIKNRRKPLSLRHAKLVHGEKGDRIWRDSQEMGFFEPTVKESNLYNCLFVNKLWYQSTLEILETRFYFADERKLRSLCERPVIKKTNSQTNTLVLHKLFYTEQYVVDHLAQQISGCLEWLEFYVCPRIIPSPTFFEGNKIQKLCIPGSAVVDDSFLKSVSKNLPNLKVLDIRACELVTDAGVYYIAHSCLNLETLNVGRHSRGELITDASIGPVVRNTKITTLGVAGCNITDRSLWQLCLNRGSQVKRLSLNNCRMLTDNSLCKILHHDYFPNLTVLEIRNCLSLSNLRPVVLFKKRQIKKGIPVLVEGCEVIDHRLREQELQIDLEVSRKIISDISGWINESADDDNDFQQLLRSR